MKQSKIRNLNNQCPGRWVSSRFSSNLAFFSFLFTFLAAIPLLGINGHITTNTTWSSDITVTGDLWIDENATLTIQAGVTVWVPKIDQNQDTIGDIDIIVNGRLVCTGTDTDKVRFLSMEDTPGSQDWAGITLSAGATQNQSILTSVHIRNAYRGILINGIGLQATDLKVYKGGDYGIRVQNTTSMTRFTFTTIEDIDGNGMTVESGSVTFTDTNITNNGGYGLKALGPVTLSATRLNLVQNGSYGLWLENTNTASFTDGRFNSNTNHGIYIDRMSPVFANCQINNNKQHGIYIIGNAGTPSFTNCTISSNHFGISFISRPGTLSYCNIENNEMYGIYIYRSNPTINNSNITNNGSVIGDPGLQTLTLPSQTSWRSTGSPVVMPLGIYNQINPNGDKMLIYNLSYEKDGDSYTNNSSSSRYYRNYTRLICNGSYFLDNTHQSNVYSYNSYDMSQISVTGTIEQIIDANSQISLEVYQIENCPNARAWVSSFSYLKFSTCGVNNLASTSANLQNNWWGQVTGIDNLVNLVIPSTANYEGAWVSRVETAGCNLPNLSPTLVLTHPEALQIDPSSYELKWIARDYDDDARVSLYYNLEEDINGILIAGNLSEDDVDSYVWNFENTPFGRYYLYARIEDGSNPALYSFALGQIMVGPLTIKIEDLYAAAGDTITVPLKAYNAYENFDLNAFQITIGYSHTLLTYVDTVV
ncbi:MAG: right-handed parallel beta-helix repeat-containing protein, partial [Candidatus Cloacimonetes bacterium]|nr:right-handed parallel beta-helix repeat-containing protein [Candidatus Cloacimonadota bacterium]